METRGLRQHRGSGRLAGLLGHGRAVPLRAHLPPTAWRRRRVPPTSAGQQRHDQPGTVVVVDRHLSVPKLVLPIWRLHLALHFPKMEMLVPPPMDHRTRHGASRETHSFSPGAHCLGQDASSATQQGALARV